MESSLISVIVSVYKVEEFILHSPKVETRSSKTFI